MYRSYQKIDRRKSKVVNVGNLKIGGDNPISVQSMTNTITSDISNTVSQIKKIVRLLYNVPVVRQIDLI